MKTIVEIHNNTEVPIRIAYSIVPLKNSVPDSNMSIYAHIVTEEILPGEFLEDEREHFGGPVHISVLSKNKWFPTNEWVDLKIVARREVEITRNKDSFICRVSFGKEE